MAALNDWLEFANDLLGKRESLHDHPVSKILFVNSLCEVKDALIYLDQVTAISSDYLHRESLFSRNLSTADMRPVASKGRGTALTFGALRATSLAPPPEMRSVILSQEQKH